MIYVLKGNKYINNEKALTCKIYLNNAMRCEGITQETCTHEIGAQYIDEFGLLSIIFRLVDLHNVAYTECNRRNVRDFGRVSLRSNYTDITQNTYIQS